MSELKVGLLALGAMAAVIYMSLLVTSNQSGLSEHVPYRAILQDASGIFPKTPIRIAGISAGRIKSIELVDNAALVTFEVLKKITIPKDSILRIKSVGFLGDKYLEIVAGRSPDGLARMELIPTEEKGGLENLTRNASELMRDLKEVASELRRTLLAKKGEDSPLKKIVSDLEKTLVNTREAAVSLNDLLSSNKKKINDIIANLQEFSENLAYQTDMENVDSAISGVDKVLANVEQASADLKEITGGVRAGKGTVGRLLVEEDLVDDVKSTLSSVRKLVGRVESIRTELALFSGRNSEYGSETDAFLKIYPSPERFYSLGFTTSKFGPEEEVHINTVTNQVQSNEVRKEKTKGEYHFSVQIGRQIQNWTLRGGMIQSSGGAGVDYRVVHWGSRFSMDVFDYREDMGINLRLSLSQQLWNIFYGKLALEDIAHSPTRSYTLSAGLRFDDEDLKGLLGFFL